MNNAEAMIEIELDVRRDVSRRLEGLGYRLC